MLNALVIDVEDWFHDGCEKSVYSIKQWDNLESRVEENTNKILEILDERNIRASFFMLGWIAERFPNLVKKISNEGHEIGSHGYAHELVYKMDVERFKNDIRKSLQIIENIINKKVLGYRAPSFSVKAKTKWVFEILVDEGIKYDASIFPSTRDFGGMPGAPRYPYIIRTTNGSIIEFPNSILKFLGIEIAFCGGGYFRLFPYWFIKYGIKRINKKGYPAIVYLHPREIDLLQPKIKLPLKRKLKYYVKLSSTENKLLRLLEDIKFGTVSQVLDINPQIFG